MGQSRVVRVSDYLKTDHGFAHDQVRIEIEADADAETDDKSGKNSESKKSIKDKLLRK